MTMEIHVLAWDRQAQKYGMVKPLNGFPTINYLHV